MHVDEHAAQATLNSPDHSEAHPPKFDPKTQTRRPGVDGPVFTTPPAPLKLRTIGPDADPVLLPDAPATTRTTATAIVGPPKPARSEDDRFYQVIAASHAETSFRHSGWAELRKRVRSAMAAAHFPSSRLERFDNCGGGAWLWMQESDGTPIIRSNHCHDRFCVACGSGRSHRIAQSLVPMVEKERTLHVVLTPVSAKDDLSGQIRSLLASFTRLRRRKFWRKRVAGGYFCLEVTRNPKTEAWHPHLHILCHAGWIDQASLSNEWHNVTGNATNVHVSLVQRHQNAVREVTKYVSKPLHPSVTANHAALVEYLRSITGVHTCATFGTWRCVELLPDLTDEERKGWKPLMTLDELLRRNASGDPWAQRIVAALSLQRVRADIGPQLPLFSSS